MLRELDLNEMERVSGGSATGQGDITNLSADGQPGTVSTGPNGGTIISFTATQTTGGAPNMHGDGSGGQGYGGWGWHGDQGFWEAGQDWIENWGHNLDHLMETTVELAQEILEALAASGEGGHPNNPRSYNGNAGQNQ